MRELVHAAKNRGFAAFTRTDHNTNSGLGEFYPAVQKENLVGIPGIEWTTYWGHMLVLDEQHHTDWRNVKPEDIDAAIAEIHKNGGIVGIAHPFALSNPVNTGYHWEFQIADWESVDFLEVWSRDDAPKKVQSLHAFALWEQLLLRGCRITATSGRDWHREDTLAYTHTYIGTEDALSTQAVLEAVRNGRVCLSAGPLLTMRARNEAADFVEIGAEIWAGMAEVEICVNTETMENDWNPAQICAREIQIIHNGLVVMLLGGQTAGVFVGTANSDPARLGEQVISGIGFLGAGTIMKEGCSIRGLTTAATLWLVACLGLAVEAGQYLVSLAGFFVSVIALRIFKFPRFEVSFLRSAKNHCFENVCDILVLQKANISNFSTRDVDMDLIQVRFDLHLGWNQKDISASELIRSLSKIPNISRIEIDML